MKKLIALLLASVMILSLAAACGSTPAPTTTTTPSTPSTPSTTTPSTPSTTTPSTPSTTTPSTPATPATPVREHEERYGGDLRIVITGISNTMDPHFSNGATSNYQWMQNVYETAIVMGADGQYYPLICDYEYSDDGLTLKLTVRDGYTFSNGQPVTIEDVVASWQRAAANGGSFAYKVMDFVTDIKIEGNSATFTFSAMNVTMMQEISDSRGPGYIMPKSICDKYGPDKQIDDINDVIGTGPYVLTEYKPDTQIIVSRNENYVPTDAGGNGYAAPRMAYCDRILYLVNSDAASRTAAMIAGDYDVGGILTEMQPYAEQIGLKSVLLHNQWTHAIFFNLSKEYNGDSIVQNKDFRKAVRAALDMNAIMLSIMQNDTDKIEMNISPITPLNTTYYNNILENAEWNIADKELAKKYLAASGYDGKEEITWLVSSGGAFYRAAMAAIPMLEDIGIKVKLWTVDGGSHGSLRGSPDSGHDIGAWETQKAVANPYESASLVVGSTAGWWENDKKTELLNILQTSPTGSAASINAYKEMCELIADEVPWIGFGTGVSKTYTQPNVELNYEGTSGYYWNTYFTDHQ